MFPDISEMTFDDVIAFYQDKKVVEEVIDALRRMKINGAGLKVLMEDDLVQEKVTSFNAKVALRYREELMPLTSPSTTSATCGNRFDSQIICSSNQ